MTPAADALFPDGWWFLLAGTVVAMSLIASVVAWIVSAKPIVCCFRCTRRGCHCCCCDRRCRRRLKEGMDRALLVDDDDDDEDDGDDGDSKKRGQGGRRNRSGPQQGTETWWSEEELRKNLAKSGLPSAEL